MTIQHILVPTDFSPSAAQALEYAIALATRLQARVTLIHVISPVLWGSGDVAAALPPTYFAELEAVAQEEIDDALTRVHAAGLTGQTLVVYVSPFERIIATARDNNVDLIVMGTHGRTGLPHLLLGSVAERVVAPGTVPGPGHTRHHGCRGGSLARARVDRIKHREDEASGEMWIACAMSPAASIRIKPSPGAPDACPATLPY